MKELKDFSKFVKSTELVIQQIEDDSSENTKVLILRLVGDVTAAGSIPIPGTGETMRLRDSKVHVAADNIDEFFKDCVEEGEGELAVLRYKGPMHLDVSKPKLRTNNNTDESIVIAQAKIWLVKTKFSRAGGRLQQEQAVKRNNFITNFFGGNKVAEVGNEDVSNMVKSPVANTGGVKQSPEPVVVDKVGE